MREDIATRGKTIGQEYPPELAADVASPLPMTERSTRRTSLRRNLPVASSTYARDTARPGRQGARSKIFATQKELDRRRPVGVTCAGLGPLATVPLIPPIADMRADINF